jgi:hypothetical protein
MSTLEAEIKQHVVVVFRKRIHPSIPLFGLHSDHYIQETETAIANSHLFCPLSTENTMKWYNISSSIDEQEVILPAPIKKPST